MKIETFGGITGKTACPGKFFLIFNEIFRQGGEIFEWSIQFRVNFSDLVSRMDFLLHI